VPVTATVHVRLQVLPVPAVVVATGRVAPEQSPGRQLCASQRGFSSVARISRVQQLLMGSAVSAEFAKIEAI